MKLKTVRYGRTFGLPNYESVRVDLEADLEEGESVEGALDGLAMAAKAYKESRFDQQKRDPIGLRDFIEVTVSHKIQRVTRILEPVGDKPVAIPGVKPEETRTYPVPAPILGNNRATSQSEANISGMPELIETGFSDEGFDPNLMKK
jgi:hypothetical protein